MKRTMENITRGSGNVFADLGYKDAIPRWRARSASGQRGNRSEERQTKLRLAHALNSIIAERRLIQAGAAARLGVNQPKVSALRHYKLEGFSVERLMTFLNALDRDVETAAPTRAKPECPARPRKKPIRKKPRSRAAAKISVVAA